MSERRLTAQWLAANAQLYTSPDRVQPDVLALLDRVPSLRPKTEIYTYDDGRTQLLLCIHGTIPIAYRGASYNIPVAIWLTLDYPREPPIVYVVPTSDMLVRQSPYVDVSGRCDLQYMRDWRAKPDTCSVLGLIDAMVDYFSSQPPLYARPRTHQRPSSPRARPSSASSSSDHDRVAHVASPPPLPRKPQQQPPPGGLPPENALRPTVGLGTRPSPDHIHPASPYAAPPGSLPQTLSQQTPPAIPPHPQAPGGQTFGYPLQPAATSPPVGPAAQTQTIASSPPPADPNRPPPVPPHPAGIQGSSIYGQHVRSASTTSGSGSVPPNSGSALGPSPPPYYYSPNGNARPTGREVQQQQGQIAFQQPQQQSHIQQQQTQPRVTTPASPPPPPPVPPSPFHVPQRQQQQDPRQHQQEQQQRFATYGQAQVQTQQQQAQTYVPGYGGSPVSPPPPPISAQSPPPPQAQAQEYIVPPAPVGVQQPTGPRYYAAAGQPATTHPYPPGAPVSQQQQQQQIQQQQQQPQPPRVPPPDLLSSDDASPPGPVASQQNTGAPFPPRPPNPELQRLHASLHTLIRTSLGQLQTSCAEAQAKQLELQRALLAGAPAVEDESARLIAVRDVCRGVSTRLRDVVGRTEGVVAEVKRRGEVEVDEMVCATSIVGNQLINLVAEDNAIEDTMYHLHRALNTGRIDLERFLRTTRVLAEEQFMKRALVEKIQKGLPMGMSIHA